ncbi:CAP domain-containing protein, partial [Akkermansiaceae bacterium]|nr:CAP domain-containing protein [Akkermansiaceae bacterium]
LADILSDERSNPFLDLPDISEKLKGHRSRIYKLIKTDYKKQPDKIAMLRHEVEILQKINGRARMIAENDPASLDKAVKGIATALAEVSREMNIIDETGFDRNQLDLDDALMSIYEGEVHLKNRKVITNIRKEIESLASARLDNNASGWASISQKDFANHLNEFRSLFALTPLRLEEKLSDAAVGHSRDMASMGFFAHQSPIPQKKSPGDRARLAGFKHRWSGENIFMGSASPVAAYDAWFGSDGHRFIMFANGPNLIGIGPYGRHWTMMTGKK